MTKRSSVFPITWLSLAGLILILDQVSKQLVSHFFHYLDPVAITSFFNILLVHNYGAAFSFLSQANGWQRWLFTIIGLVAAGVIYYLLRRHQSKRLFCTAISFILGGALGNVLDRIMHGYVIDFLDLHWKNWHWPAFNLADSAICLGAILLILDELLRVNHKR